MKDNTGRWSHWSAPVQFVAGEPMSQATPVDLRITELMYNPPAPPAGDPTDKDDFEFVELQNVGAETLDLSSVSFTEGIAFDFKDGAVTVLAPGAFVLVVKNITAFESRYGSGLSHLIAGEYAGRLSNGGEKIVLIDFWEGTILEFEYSDDWYARTPSARTPATGEPGLHGSPAQTRAAPPERSRSKWLMRFFAVFGAVMLLSIPGLVTAQDTPVISGQSSDWIEIYNPAETTVNLEGWFLTDDADNLTKWEFPSVEIPARGFLLVFASGEDRSDRLSGAGEFLALVEPDGVTIAHGYDEYPQQFAGITYGRTGDAIVSVTQTELIGERAEAAALIPGDDALETAWTGVDFDDSAWLSGTTGVGYDYAGLVGLDVGAMRNTNPSVYVRVSFDVADASEIDELVLQMKYEDGFAAYLNGRLVATSNAPPVEQLAFDSLAAANRLDSDAVEYQEFDLSDSLDVLRTGANVLAVHGLNVTLSSSDLLVLPRLIATEIETATAADVTEGYFTEPTPGGINSPVLAQLGPAVSERTNRRRVAFRANQPLDGKHLHVRRNAAHGRRRRRARRGRGRRGVLGGDPVAVLPGRRYGALVRAGHR